MSSETTAVPCAARPSTAFSHPEGQCRCFYGGPAPEFPPETNAALRAGVPSFFIPSPRRG